MFDMPSGKYVKANLATNDASTAQQLTLKDSDGNTVTLAPGQRLSILECQVSGGAAGLITIFQDRDGSGTLGGGNVLFSTNFASGQPSPFPNATAAIVSMKVPPGATGTKGQFFAVTGAAVANTRVTLIGIVHDT